MKNPQALSYPGLVPGGQVMTDQGVRQVWIAAPSGEDPTEVNLTSGLKGTQKLIQVAVGVLIEPTGRFLMTSRPPGKVYAGYWEFPGGKFEARENACQALTRELEEELGIQAQHIDPWRVECIVYPHGLVELHFCKVTLWTGEITMREGQSFAWETLPVSVSPVLPGTRPVLYWLAEDADQSGMAC